MTTATRRFLSALLLVTLGCAAETGTAPGLAEDDKGYATETRAGALAFATPAVAEAILSELNEGASAPTRAPTATIGAP